MKITMYELYGKIYDEPSETGSYEIVTVDLLQILDKVKN